jgi:hypothetical protein
MWVKKNLPRVLQFSASVLACLLLSTGSVAAVAGITPIPEPSPISNSYGLVAVKTQAPPTQAATISIPANGASFSTSPITVSGICPSGLLVQVYDNGVMVGAINCTSGSFSIQVSLFTGQNQLTADDYDDLGQQGPVSNTVTVTYNNAHITAFGQLITLTSDYGRRAADTGTDLTWPLLLSGGTGPYAFSINWGDNTPTQLKSVALTGVVTIDHVYKTAGIYHLTVQATDVNGVSAFLQLVAVSNGNASASYNSTNGSSSSSSNASKTNKSASSEGATIAWIPAVASIVLMVPIYWLGRKSEIVALRKKLEKDMKDYHGE